MNMYAMLLDKAFKDADKDSNGEIDKKELRGVLNSAAKDLKITEVTDEEVNKYLIKLDLDKNGTINQQEFGKLFQEMISAKKK